MKPTLEAHGTQPATEVEEGRNVQTGKDWLAKESFLEARSWEGHF